MLEWGHRGREAFRKRCPDRVGREAKSFRGLWRWWASSGFVTPDRARWGSFSVRHQVMSMDYVVRIPCHYAMLTRNCLCNG
jgi:hypothetical protein